MYVAKVFQRRADGSKRVYWVLKASYWDSKTQRPRHKYLAYIGTSARIPESKARELAAKASQKLGRRVTVEDLRRVKRLRIVPDEPTGEPKPEPGVLTLSDLKRRKRDS